MMRPLRAILSDMAKIHGPAGIELDSSAFTERIDVRLVEGIDSDAMKRLVEFAGEPVTLSGTFVPLTCAETHQVLIDRKIDGGYEGHCKDCMVVVVVHTRD